MRQFKFFLAALAFLFTNSSHASDQLLNNLKPNGTVNDFANVIPAAQEHELTSIITELKQKTGVEFAIVTVSSMDGGQIDDFTNRLFERWGVGQKGKDNGLMFLAAMKERKMRIEVGYGLEGVIPDATAGRIRRNIIKPSFKKGNYAQGILRGVHALAYEITKDPSTTHHYRNPTDQSARDILYKIGGLLLLIAIPSVLFCKGIPKKKPRSGRERRTYRGYGSSGGFGGGCSGGSFGGGGFGGGCSGGGGSSGGW